MGFRKFGGSFGRLGRMLGQAGGGAATTSVGFQIKAGDQPTLIQVTAGHIIHMIEEAATASLQSQAVAFGTGTFT